MYKFYERVKIVKGFYEGREGKLINIDNDIEDKHCWKKYDVEIIVLQSSRHMPMVVKTITVSEEYLKKLK